MARLLAKDAGGGIEHHLPSLVGAIRWHSSDRDGGEDAVSTRYEPKLANVVIAGGIWPPPPFERGACTAAGSDCTQAVGLC